MATYKCKNTTKQDIINNINTIINKLNKIKNIDENIYNLDYVLEDLLEGKDTMFKGVSNML